jgi:hypothetical protein
MKKSAPKLVICRETLRVLARIELGVVGGGNEAEPRAGTRNAGTGCPFVPAQEPAKP